jgi:hypothetical protein
MKFNPAESSLEVGYLKLSDGGAFYLDGNLVGTLTRGDSTGTNASGRRRVTWYGELELPGFTRPFRPSGSKTDVVASIKRKCRRWEKEQKENLTA